MSRCCEVPDNAYYGVHTLRAMENFPITGTAISIYPELIKALACIKQAAALANHELGLLDEMRTTAIVKACGELIDGKLHEQFVVDVIQGGAGTSTNMNANEVIANRALELMGHRKGQYQHLHPNEDVNIGQSTNDVYPSALKIAVRALGVTASKRLDAMPATPTVGEQGYDVVTSASRGLAAPAGTPEDILKLLRSAVADAAKDPAFIDSPGSRACPSTTWTTRRLQRTSCASSTSMAWFGRSARPCSGRGVCVL